MRVSAETEKDVRHFHALYADAVFRKDFEAFGKCFTDRSEWRIAGRVVVGRTEIVSFLAQLMVNFHRVVMTFRTPIITATEAGLQVRTLVTEQNGFKDGRPGTTVGTYYECLIADSGSLRRAWSLFQLHYIGPPDFSGSFFEQPDYGAPPGFPPPDAPTFNFGRVHDGHDDDPVGR